MTTPRRAYDSYGVAFFTLLFLGCLVFFTGATSADQAPSMIDTHTDLIRHLESQVIWLRGEAAVIITSMASALGALYLYSRRDGKASREVLRELVSVLREHPCLYESKYINSDKPGKEDPRED